MNAAKWMPWVALACAAMGCVLPPQQQGPVCESQEDCFWYEKCAGGLCVSKDTCIPATCEELGAVCGLASDGCGGSLECGTCTAGQVCGPSNRCECGQSSTPRDTGEAFLLSWDRYERVFPGASRLTALATDNWRLDFLQADGTSGRPLKPVVVSDSAVIESVSLPPLVKRNGSGFYETPARAWFGETSGNPTRTLRWVDLATGRTGAVPQSTHAVDGSVVFGPHGGVALFSRGAGAQEVGREGELLWSDGQTTTLLGGHVTGSPVLLNEARTTALAALLTEEGTRELVAITMATGAKALVHAGVKAERGLAQFGASADGSRVVVVTESGAVLLLEPAEGVSTQVAASGGLATISADGSTVAYVSSGRLMVWRDGETRSLADTTPGLGAPPRLSADGEWVVFFDDVVNDLRPVAKVSVVRTDGSDSPLLVGENSGLSTLRFLGTGGSAAYLTAVVEQKDIVGLPDAKALGQAVLVDLKRRTRQTLGSNTFPRDVVALEQRGELAFNRDYRRGPGLGTVAVAKWGDEPTTLGEDVRMASLRVGPVRDDLLFRGDCSQGISCHVYVRSESSCGGEATRLLPETELVADAVFTPEGRVLAVVDWGAKTGVWSLPIQ